MISSLARIPGKTQRSSTVTVAAPLGGWNARDALGAMNKLDAVTLTNLWPGTSSVILRKGYTEHATQFFGQCESLMAYNSGTTSTLFAAADTNIYDVTTPGSVGSPSLLFIASPRFQHINFTTTGGSYLMMVNGAEKLLSWNGSSWNRDGDGAPYDITNVDTSTCVNITVFKNRIWLIQTGTLKAWYLPINAIGGAAASLDMSSIAQKGGYLMAAMTWTLDAGYGIDDYLAFITSNGEVMLWRLTDPTAPSGIAMIGLFSIGSPIGRRCWVKYGGDLLIITRDGVVPMSSGLQSSRLDPRVSITDKIQFAMGAAISAYGANFGWQLFNFPKEGQLYLNVPVTQGLTQQQYVQNNITRSWCNFTGWAANCWELFNDEPYFGGNTFVGHAWNGESDAGADIPGLAIQSFQSYGQAREKHCKMVRFHLFSSAEANIFGDVNVDYDTSDRAAQLSIAPPTGSLWDAGLWDTAVWGGDLERTADWQGATGIGYTFAPFLKTATNNIQLEWIATDMLFESGGVL